jgi:hypothetical protein
MLFSDESVIGLQGVRHVVLVRDPYDWVLARARFYLSDEFQGSLNHIKNGAVSAEEIMNMMIFGVHQKAPSLLDIYQFNAAAWMGTGAYLIHPWSPAAGRDRRSHAQAVRRALRLGLAASTTRCACVRPSRAAPEPPQVVDAPHVIRPSASLFSIGVWRKTSWSKE